MGVPPTFTPWGCDGSVPGVQGQEPPASHHSSQRPHPVTEGQRGLVRDYFSSKGGSIGGGGNTTMEHIRNGLQPWASHRAASQCRIRPLSLTRPPCPVCFVIPAVKTVVGLWGRADGGVWPWQPPELNGENLPHLHAPGLRFHGPGPELGWWQGKTSRQQPSLCPKCSGDHPEAGLRMGLQAGGRKGDNFSPTRRDSPVLSATAPVTGITPLQETSDAHH